MWILQPTHRECERLKLSHYYFSSGFFLSELNLPPLNSPLTKKSFYDIHIFARPDLILWSALLVYLRSHTAKPKKITNLKLINLRSSHLEYKITPR